MTPLNKKLLIYGGGAFVAAIVLYMLFKKRVGTVNPTPAPPLPPTPPVDQTVPNKVFTKAGTRLRKEPNTNSTILKTYQIGQTLTPISASTQSDGIWYLVGEGGYVRSDVVME
jgi:uncharacterized protein YgiM (DUF1202 family)